MGDLKRKRNLDPFQTIHPLTQISPPKKPLLRLPDEAVAEVSVAAGTVTTTVDGGRPLEGVLIPSGLRRDQRCTNLVSISFPPLFRCAEQGGEHPRRVDEIYTIQRDPL